MNIYIYITRSKRYNYSIYNSEKLKKKDEYAISLNRDYSKIIIIKKNTPPFIKFIPNKIN